MSRYVDFHLIGELVDSHGNVHYEDLKNLPTTDVVEVVRCKDCIHYKNLLLGQPATAFGCNVHNWFSGEDDYCSYGERREE